MTLARARALDAADPLAPLRDRFVLPEGVIYLDGNSLGALPRATAERQRGLVEHEWGERLIRSWNEAGWIDAPQRVGARIARLIGAKPHEVIVADSTSVNLFKLLVAAAKLSDRPSLLTEAGNFHTDLHIASGAAELTGLRLDIAPARGGRGADRARHQPPSPHARPLQDGRPLRHGGGDRPGAGCGRAYRLGPQPQRRRGAAPAG
jgi:kynureninase